MRRTIWVARTPTMARMHEAAGRKVAATERRTMITALANAGVDDPEQWIDRARIEVLALLRAEGPLNSRTIGSRLPRLNLTLRLAPGTKWEARQSAHTRLMTLLGFEGVLARTTPIGGWHTSEFAWLPTEDVIGTALTGPRWPSRPPNSPRPGCASSARRPPTICSGGWDGPRPSPGRHWPTPVRYRSD